MTVQINTTAEIDGVRLIKQGSHPSTPSAGHVLAYYITGTAQPGLFIKDDAGRQIGPFITGTSASVASGALVLLEEHIAANSSSLDFTTFISSTYDEYMVEGVEIKPATDGVDFQMLYGTGGGPTYDTTAADYFWSMSTYSSSGAGVADNGAGSVGYMKLLKTVQNDAGFGVGTFSIRLTGLQSTANVKYHHGTCVFHNGAAFCQGIIGGGWIVYATAVTALRFQFSSGNITSGVVRIYGVAKA